MKRFALKRITALVLALVMTLSLLPMNVWAEELQQTGYEPLYWSEDGGATYHNGIEEPYEQPVNNDGRMVNLYVKEGSNYLAIDSETFNNDTITKLNEDIGFVGWSINGDGVEMFFWNTENVADGTEGGVVFTVGETQYRINLRVMTAADGAADFVAQYAKDADGNIIDISTLVDSSDENARRIYYGALRWDQLSDAEKLAVDDILSKANVTFAQMARVAVPFYYRDSDYFESVFIGSATTITGGNAGTLASGRTILQFLSETVQAEINETVNTRFLSLKEAGTTLTYYDLAAAASFISNYLIAFGNPNTILDIAIISLIKF